MKQVHIKSYLESIGVSLSDLSLGDFDHIGEYTAKKSRGKDSPLYGSVGSFFRPNYERGLLIYSLITKYKLTSYLEVGFGRGYSAICAAKAFYDIGSDAKVVTIDPNFDQNQMNVMAASLPHEWLSKLDFCQGTSDEVLPKILPNASFDLVYIDGDHRAAGVQRDWDQLKGSWNRFCLFDDYHLPTKKEADIECAQVIDAINEEEFDATKELIILDRRIFLDDRGFTDAEIDYGQVLLTKKTREEW